MKKICIIRSETVDDIYSLDLLQSVLDDSINDFVTDSDNIINIEFKEDRFWIYIRSKNEK